MRSKEEIDAMVSRFASIDEDTLSAEVEASMNAVMDALFWVLDAQNPDSTVEQYLLS